MNKNNRDLINEKINVDRVRIVGKIEPTDEIDLKEALEISKKLDLDLILVTTNNEGVGICKIDDFKNYIFKKKKKKQEAKKNSKKQENKEVRFGPNTESHDYQFKLKNIRKFLEKGAIVKTYVTFKGREIQYQENAKILLLTLISDCLDISIPNTTEPELINRRMIIILSPKKELNI